MMEVTPMAINVKAATELMEKTIQRISKDNASWRSFLRSAGRSCKYSFRDQLMIHAQRPEATACATKEQWDRLDRRVPKDAKGIVLLEEQGRRTNLRYVYDVSDTIEPADSRPIGLFVMKPEYRDPIQKRIESAFSLNKTVTMENTILRAALNLSCEYWKRNRTEILHTFRQDSFDGEDAQTIGNAFVALLATSIAYTLLTRLTNDPDRQVRISHFDNITRLHESDSIQLLGAAMSESVSHLFKEVILGVHEFRKERKTLPYMAEHEKTDILRAAAPEPDVPKCVYPEPDVTETARQEEPAEPESDPPAPEHVKDVPSHSGYVAILNSDITKDDLERLDHEYPIVMEIPEEEFCRILTNGTLTEQGKQHVKQYFEQESDPDKRCEFLRTEFGTGGRSWVLPGNVGVFIDYGRSGITIWRYKDNQEVRYRWPEVASSISALIGSGRYLSDDPSLPRETEAGHAVLPIKTRNVGRDI